jgi:alpha-aminoadipate carrier protein LysW
MENKNMNCPECAAKLNIPEDASVGEIVSCPDCGADFEISKKDGSTVEIKQAETVGEDWGE